MIDYNEELLRYQYTLKGNYRKGINNLRTILSTPLTRNEFLLSHGVNVLFGLPCSTGRYTHDGNSAALLDVLHELGFYDEALKTFITLHFSMERDSYEAMFENPEQMAALAASPVAMAALAASPVALSAIARSATGRDAVITSEHWSSIAENDRAITRYALALAGRDTEECESMAAIAASATAMAAIAASATALLACARSAVSMQKICSTPLAFNVMLKTDDTRNALCSSNYLQTNYSKIVTATENTTYFVRKADCIDSGNYRAINTGGKESSTAPNQSVFLAFKIGAWTNGNSVTGTVSHMQNSAKVLSKSTSSGGGAE